MRLRNKSEFLERLKEIKNSRQKTGSAGSYTDIKPLHVHFRMINNHKSEEIRGQLITTTLKVNSSVYPQL